MLRPVKHVLRVPPVSARALARASSGLTRPYHSLAKTCRLAPPKLHPTRSGASSSRTTASASLARLSSLETRAGLEPKHAQFPRLPLALPHQAVSIHPRQGALKSGDGSIGARLQNPDVWDAVLGPDDMQCVGPMSLPIQDRGARGVPDFQHHRPSVVGMAVPCVVRSLATSLRAPAMSRQVASGSSLHRQ